MSAIEQKRRWHLTYDIRGTLISSRFALAPINTGFCVDGRPTKGLLDFHARRSGNHIGISYVGNVAVDARYTQNSRTPLLMDEPSWKQISAVIQANGSTPAIQLACNLEQSEPHRNWLSRDRPGVATAAQSLVSSLSTTTMGAVADAFVSASEKAVEWGFPVVQVHAAHGYFLSKTVLEATNQRTDEYGRPTWHLLSSIVDRMAGLTPRPVIDVRLSVTSGLGDPDHEIEHWQKTVAAVVEAGADMVSISNGMYNVDRRMIYPTRAQGETPYLRFALLAAETHPDTIVNVAGNCWRLAEVLPKLPDNVMVGIGRGLIADPGMVRAQMEGRAFSACSNRGHCHYYSRGARHMACGVNESVGSADCLLPITPHDPTALM